MKKRSGCLGLLFSASIIIGILIGSIFEFGRKSVQAERAQPTPTYTAIPPTPSNDLTILFVGVNKLPPQTSYLISAWLLQQEYHIEDSVTDIHLTLRVLYPVLPEIATSSTMRQLSQSHSPLVVNPDDISTITSLPPISELEKKWDFVIIIDEYFMNSAILLSDLNNTPVLEPPPEDLFKKPWESPTDTFQQQSAILKNFCNAPDAFYQYSIADKLVQLAPDHIVSNLDINDLFVLWQITVNAGADFTLTCEFFPQQ